SPNEAVASSCTYCFSSWCVILSISAASIWRSTPASQAVNRHSRATAATRDSTARPQLPRYIGDPPVVMGAPAPLPRYAGSALAFCALCLRQQQFEHDLLAPGQRPPADRLAVAAGAQALRRLQPALGSVEVLLGRLCFLQPELSQGQQQPHRWAGFLAQFQKRHE